MNRAAIATLAVTTLFFLASTAFSDSISVLKRKGLLGKVTVILKDTRHNPIPNATVHFFLENGRGKDGYQEMTAKTDEEGKASIEGRIRINLVISVSPKGFHRLHKEYVYLTLDKSQMSGDKWQPFERTYELTLLERQNFNTPQHRRFFIKFPVSTNGFRIFMPKSRFGEPTLAESEDSMFSFDFKWCRETNALVHVKKLTLSADDDGGFRVIKRGEEGSGMIFPYLFPTNGYESVYHCEMIRSNKVFKSSRFDIDSEFLAFRAREIPVASVDGAVREDRYYYGLIEDLDLGLDFRNGVGKLIIEYLYNEEPNDTTCEYDYY